MLDSWWGFLLAVGLSVVHDAREVRDEVSGPGVGVGLNIADDVAHLEPLSLLHESVEVVPLVF